MSMQEYLQNWATRGANHVSRIKVAGWVGKLEGMVESDNPEHFAQLAEAQVSDFAVKSKTIKYGPDDSTSKSKDTSGEDFAELIRVRHGLMDIPNENDSADSASLRKRNKRKSAAENRAAQPAPSDNGHADVSVS